MSVRTIVITSGVVSRVRTVLIQTGPPGRSAYQSYLATTSDDPVLTEAQWAAGGSSVSLTSLNGLATLVVNGTSITFPATLNP